MICFASLLSGFFRRSLPRGASVAIALNCRSGVFLESLFSIL